jgi:hypothetical protein
VTMELPATLATESDDAVLKGKIWARIKEY